MKALVLALKFLFSSVALGFALIPLWVFLWIKHSLDPAGFWQKFAVYGVGVYLLGGLQILFLILWVGVLTAIWVDN